MSSDQFFTNEAILAGLGYPSSFINHNRYVFKSTKEEAKEILESAKRVEEMANEWIKKGE